MSPALKNGLLLVLLIAILGGAGWFFTKGKKERTYPDDPSTITHWMCDKCHKHFDLTAAQYKDWLDSTDKVRRDKNFPGTVAVFWCPDCKIFSVVRAQVDPTTKEWVIERDSAGNAVLPGGAKAPPKGAEKGAKGGEKPAKDAEK